MSINTFIREPEFTKKVRSDICKQAKAGTLSNTELWKQLEDDVFDGNMDYVSLSDPIAYDEVAHLYWYTELLTPAQKEAYPYIRRSTNG